MTGEQPGRPTGSTKAPTAKKGGDRSGNRHREVV
jgi:hypothetical protein